MHHIVESARLWALGLAIVARIALTSDAAADGLTPLRDSRLAAASAQQFGCDPYSQLSFLVGHAFAPLYGSVAAEIQCGADVSGGSATHRSRVTSTSLVASGEITFDGAATGAVLHGGGLSRFEITFRVDAPASYAVTGEFTAIRAPTSWSFGAEGTVTLYRADFSQVFSEGASAPSDGSLGTWSTSRTGELAPGEYRLIAEAQSGTDSIPREHLSGAATFRVRFDLPTDCPADLDGNAAVGLGDLIILLSDFGCEGGGCAGDVDREFDTGLSDLLLLLASFGQTCP